MNERDIIIWLTSLRGVGPQTILFLKQYFGSLDEFWYSNERDIPLNVLPKRKRDILRKIYSYKKNSINFDYFEKLENEGVSVVVNCDDNFPKKLRDIPQSPCVLYYKGNIQEVEKSLAIVGPRKASYYGRWAAEKYSKEIAKAGVCIVSGLAKGIDAIAHKGALESNQITYAVLGNGLDRIYPKCNEKLYSQIEESGALISEYPLGMEPKASNFPQRNRIISGLSDAVFVVEAKKKSGTLITVDYALKQGKDVLVLPGNVNSLYSQGTNQLIKEGAIMVTECKDILENLYGVFDSNPEDCKLPVLSESEKIVYNLLENGPIHFDAIGYETNFEASKLNSILTLLEIKGIIMRLPRNIFQLRN